MPLCISIDTGFEITRIVVLATIPYDKRFFQPSSINHAAIKRKSNIFAFMPGSVIHGTMQVAWPGKPIWITPAQAHISFASLFSAGIFPIRTVGAPVIQGPVGTGTQGMGVSTPRAAAVAAATAGLAMLEHMPKGATLTMGVKSMMVAAGGPPTMVQLAGSTFRVPGAAPKLHCSTAPEHTQIDMVAPYFFFGPASTPSLNCCGAAASLPAS
jgi:hypothetical protein